MKLKRVTLLLITTLLIAIVTYSYGRRWNEVHDVVRYASRDATFTQTKDQTLDNCESVRALRTRKTGIAELPVPIINDVKAFVFFMGHSRSGHSIIGTILDSHPHIVIAHEGGILTRVVNKEKCADKSFIFNEIWRSSCSNKTKSVEGTARKGYSLRIDELYQGKYLDHIDIMGEKQGSSASLFYARSPDKFRALLDKLKAAVNVPIKVLHVVRNPYDNIATLILYKRFEVAEVTKLKYSNETITVDPKIVDSQTNSYFMRYKAIEEAEKALNLDLMRIHNTEFVSQPRVIISKMCAFLGITCSNKYIDKCSEKIFKKESKTRYKLKWQDYQIKKIKANIQESDSLSRYDFNS